MTSHATTPIAAALAGALTAQTVALAKRLPRAMAGDVAAVHKGRVATRRLRETLALAASLDRSGLSTRLRREARRVTRALGPVRELDVAIDELDRAAARHAWPADGVAAVRRHLEAHRERLRARMRLELEAVDVDALQRDCRVVADALLEHGSPSECVRAAGARVSQRAARVTAAAARCGTLYAADRLHALRIAVKKLRYAVELLACDARVQAAPALETFRLLQQQLGHLHDLQVLRAEVEATGTAHRRPAATDEWHAMAAALECDCREVHGRVLPELPALKSAVAAARREAALARRGDRARMIKAAAPSAAGVPRIRRASTRHAPTGTS